MLLKNHGFPLAGMVFSAGQIASLTEAPKTLDPTLPIMQN